MKNFALATTICGVVFGATGVAMAGISVPYTSNLGTTQLVYRSDAPGADDWCLELFNPAAGGIHYAGMKVTALGDPTVSNFSCWDYWTRSNSQSGGPYAYHGVNFDVCLDTSYPNMVIGGTDYGYDVLLRIMPHNTLFYEGGDSAQPIPADTWVNLDSLTRYPYQFFAWDGTGTYLGGYDIATQSNAIMWSEFQSLDPINTTWGNTYDFSTATVKMVLMRTGGGGIITDVTAHLDDFKLNCETYAIVPVPTSMLLGAMGLGLVGWLKRRRSPKQEG